MKTAGNADHREPWNKGKIVGQKAPFIDQAFVHLKLSGPPSTQIHASNRHENFEPPSAA